MRTKLIPVIDGKCTIKFTPVLIGLWRLVEGRQNIDQISSRAIMIAVKRSKKPKSSVDQAGINILNAACVIASVS